MIEFGGNYLINRVQINSLIDKTVNHTNFLTKIFPNMSILQQYDLILLLKNKYGAMLPLQAQHAFVQAIGTSIKRFLFKCDWRVNQLRYVAETYIRYIIYVSLMCVLPILFWIVNCRAMFSYVYINFSLTKSQFQHAWTHCHVLVCG